MVRINAILPEDTLVKIDAIAKEKRKAGKWSGVSEVRKWRELHKWKNLLKFKPLPLL